MILIFNYVNKSQIQKITNIVNHSNFQFKVTSSKFKNCQISYLNAVNYIKMYFPLPYNVKHQIECLR